MVDLFNPHSSSRLGDGFPDSNVVCAGEMVKMSLSRAPEHRQQQQHNGSWPLLETRRDNAAKTLQDLMGTSARDYSGGASNSTFVIQPDAVDHWIFKNMTNQQLKELSGGEELAVQSHYSAQSSVERQLSVEVPTERQTSGETIIERRTLRTVSNRDKGSAAVPPVSPHAERLELMDAVDMTEVGGGAGGRLRGGDGSVKFESTSPDPVRDASRNRPSWDFSGLFNSSPGARKSITLGEVHLLQSIGQGVICTDLEGKITYWNRAAEAIYQWKAEEVLGQNIVKFLSPTYLEKQFKEIIGKVGHGESWSGTYPAKRRDGVIINTVVTDTPIVDQNNKIVGIIGVSFDASSIPTSSRNAIKRSHSDECMFTEIEREKVPLTGSAEGRNILSWKRSLLEEEGSPPRATSLEEHRDIPNLTRNHSKEEIVSPDPRLTESTRSSLLRLGRTTVENFVRKFQIRAGHLQDEASSQRVDKRKSQEHPHLDQITGGMNKPTVTHSHCPEYVASDYMMDFGVGDGSSMPLLGQAKASTGVEGGSWDSTSLQMEVKLNPITVPQAGTVNLPLSRSSSGSAPGSSTGHDASSVGSPTGRSVFDYEWNSKTDINLLRAVEDFRLQMALALRVGAEAAAVDDIDGLASIRGTRGNTRSMPNTNKMESMSYRYWMSNSLGYEDRIEDGFYEIWGMSPYVWCMCIHQSELGRMPSLEQLRAVVPDSEATFEVISVDRNTDSNLRELEDKAVGLAYDSSIVLTMASRLSIMVADVMGGPVQSDNELLADWQSCSHKLMQMLGSIVLPVGILRVGLVRHRALLFKVMADSIGLPCRIMRVPPTDGRDDEVSVFVKCGDENREWMVDLLVEPGRILTPDKRVSLPPVVIPSPFQFDRQGSFPASSVSVLHWTRDVPRGRDGVKRGESPKRKSQRRSPTREGLMLKLQNLLLESSDYLNRNVRESNEEESGGQSLDANKVYPQDADIGDLLLEDIKQPAVIEHLHMNASVDEDGKEPDRGWMKGNGIVSGPNESSPAEEDMTQPGEGWMKEDSTAIGPIESAMMEGHRKEPEEAWTKGDRCVSGPVESDMPEEAGKDPEKDWIKEDRPGGPGESTTVVSGGKDPKENWTKEDRRVCGPIKSVMAEVGGKEPEKGWMKEDRRVSGRAESTIVEEGRKESEKGWLKEYRHIGRPSESPGSGTTVVYGESEVSDFEVGWEDLKIGDPIGQGSFGKVFRADWQGSDVAVKVFLEQDVRKEALEDFRSEVGIMRRLRHPNIVLFMGAVTRPPNLSIITEFCPRGSLYRLLHRPNRELDERKRIRMAVDVAKGMNYLHRCSPPVVHRDLKSPNLLVDKNWTVKVCDFGMSKLKHNTFLSSKSSAGTPEWTAPEVLRNEPCDEKSDVYSFGVILWELATLEVPWSGLNAVQVVAAVGFQLRTLKIPDNVELEVAAIIESCLQNEPSLRPSFAQLMHCLKVLQSKGLTTQSTQKSLKDQAPAEGPPRDQFHPSPAAIEQGAVDPIAPKQIPIELAPLEQPRPNRLWMKDVPIENARSRQVSIEEASMGQPLPQQASVRQLPLEKSLPQQFSMKKISIEQAAPKQVFMKHAPTEQQSPPFQALLKQAPTVAAPTKQDNRKKSPPEVAAIIESHAESERMMQSHFAKRFSNQFEIENMKGQVPQSLPSADQALAEQICLEQAPVKQAPVKQASVEQTPPDDSCWQTEANRRPSFADLLNLWTMEDMKGLPFPPNGSGA